MSSDTPPPLWLESIPDREPWRRGRDAICFITLIVLLGQAALVARSILQGDVRKFLLTVSLSAIACLLLYFIWIGRNWPRWIIAPFFACSGFANVIWGMTKGDGPLFLTGIAALTIFTYLALAPSVYAFARHQRERIKLTESLVVGLIFLLLLASIGSGCYAFYSYETGLEREAVSFAATTFNKVFVYPDEEFLQSNLKDDERAMTPHDFIARRNRELGEPLRIGELESAFTTRLVARRLMIEGRFQVPVIYDSYGPVWVNIQVSRIGNGWQIDHIGWSYEPRKLHERR
jgi:hypothetical protein